MVCQGRSPADLRFAVHQCSLPSLSVLVVTHLVTQPSAVKAWAGLSTADLSIEATRPTGHCLVDLGWFQRAQGAGSYQDHFVIAAASGLIYPGHPGPPGTIAFMPFPGEQVRYDAIQSLLNG